MDARSPPADQTLGALCLDALRQSPRVSYYFRYPLRRSDFFALIMARRLRGHYAAKPLYNGLDAARRVDRTAGFSGDIAALFVPLGARVVDDVKVVLAHIDPDEILLDGRRRNWRSIRRAAADGIRANLQSSVAEAVRSAESGGREGALRSF